ncbi:hypothetical protein [Burkholderia cenocepacia]|uniref:hypothetical protein n=1 Tax=Burkholderia cenocepacia TaxID=95486 RepID=UPI00222FA8F4|nr:hypothetical protein [Burkholderia cenocepacia]MCW3632860.1 hypothetical protein [Burkholderia cenocepacia]MCW5182358.1 hypothetical protein [Burkholderia cenocepacia]
MNRSDHGRSSTNIGQALRVGELIAQSAAYFAQNHGAANRRSDPHGVNIPSHGEPEAHPVGDPMIAIAQLEVAINRLRRRRFDVDGNGIVIDFHDRQREQLTTLYRHMIQNRIGGVALSSLSSGERFALQVAERL